MKKLIALLMAMCLGLPCLPVLAEEAALTVPAQGVLTIDSAGTYRISGTTANGRIVITAPKKAEVTLILDGLDVTSLDGPALMSENSIDLTLETAAGTVNRLVSGAQQEVLTASAAGEAEGGAVLVKGDLTIDGEGALFVGGYLNNGVQASGSIKVRAGALTVEAVHVGLRGKKGVKLKGGELRVTAGGDGVSASDKEKGAVTVSGGTLAIHSGGDAVQAQTDLTVEGGTLEATTGTGSASVTITAGDDWGRGGWDDFGRGGRNGMGGRGGKGGFDRNPGNVPGGVPEMPGGMNPPEGMPVPAGSDAGPAANEAADASAAEDTVSRKGLKCSGTLTVSGGVITLDAMDDAMHAQHVTVSGGTLTLSSGDDGVHADQALTIVGGSLTVLRSKEGLEGLTVEIGGGEIAVTAVDDGINASDGSGETGFAFGGRGSRNADRAAASDGTPLLHITGGSVYVNAEGDGLDANGDLLVEGGTVIVDGPTASGNGALDAGKESGGSCLISGGTVLAIGAAGMAEAFDAASGQSFFAGNVTIAQGAEIIVTGADGTVLVRHTALKAASHLVFSCPGLADGDALNITVNGVVIPVTANRELGGSSFGGWGWR